MVLDYKHIKYIMPVNYLLVKNGDYSMGISHLYVFMLYKTDWSRISEYIDSFYLAKLW